MTGRQLVATGWMAFAVSGVLFVVSGIRANDPWAITGSVVWLIGVAVFLWGTARGG